MTSTLKEQGRIAAATAANLGVLIFGALVLNPMLNGWPDDEMTANGVLLITFGFVVFVILFWAALYTIEATSSYDGSQEEEADAS